MDLTKIVHECSHCGNTGILTFIAKIDTPVEECEVNDRDEIVWCGLIENTRWYFFQCPVCKKPVLISEYTMPMMIEDKSIIETVFPKISIHFDGVPDNIKTAFQSAIKIRGIDKAICVLSLRRTLEMICKDKGAQGNSLESKIDDLIDKKILPDMMSNACWIVRQSGNEAAHADDVEFTEYEVEEIVHYVAIVIEYLYSLPVRVATLKEKIEERKNNKK